MRLPLLIGRGRVLEVILGCGDVDARTAEVWVRINRALPVDELWPFVDRLVRRMASSPPHAVAAAKTSVLRADIGVTEQLLAECDAFIGTLSGPDTHDRLRRFLETGGQTRDGELELTALLDGL